MYFGGQYSCFGVQHHVVILHFGGGQQCFGGGGHFGLQTETDIRILLLKVFYVWAN